MSVDSKKVELYTLRNDNGLKIEITNFGGKVISIHVPDKNGKFADVALGFDKPEDYILGNPYFGALVGRHANRIGGGKFTLEGKEYQLAKNVGENHLHGGNKGFNDVFWDAKQIETNEGQALELSYLSKDGEENYPGNLSIKVIYLLTEKNELKIDYFASTDKTTIINLTHHSFFNLAGEGNGDVLNHQVLINADAFTVTDKDSIPTGEIRKVDGTPMDFRKVKSIGRDIEKDYEPLIFANGFDHNWVLNKEKDKLSFAASAYESNSGRYMEVWTDQPGMQLYTGNYLDGSDIGKGGKTYERRTAFCFETQHFPDSPNHADFPSTELKPGKEYRHTCIYKFSAK